MAAPPPNVRYIPKSAIGYPTNDDVAALRLVRALVGTGANKGPLWVYKPSQLLTTANTDFTVGGRGTMPLESQDALNMWIAAYEDAVEGEKMGVEWVQMMDRRAALNAAPVYNTFGSVTSGEQLSSSQKIVDARRRLWGRLRKYGAMYSIGPASMARALTTVFTSQLAANHTGADFLMRFDGGQAAIAPASGHLTDAALASVWDTKGPQIYTLMFGAPPLLNPSVLNDVNTFPVESVYRAPRSKSYRKSKKKRRYY